MIKYDDNYKKIQGSHFAVAWIKRNYEAPCQHITMHYHRDMELLFIDEGETSMQIAGRTLCVKGGSLLIVNPYEVHSGEVKRGGYAHRCICFDMELLGLPHADQILSGGMGYVNVIEEAVSLEPHFTACYEAVKERTDGWELRAKGNLLMLFSSLTDRMVSTVPSKDQTFSKGVLDYIEEHYAEDITSREVAEHFSYDHSYFCRKFKVLFLRKFSDFLNEYRVTIAKEMLLAHSVTETAIKCGFQNIGYFSRVFKSYTGVNPSGYAKEKR
jgi:AraC-like DNA-binding protein